VRAGALTSTRAQSILRQGPSQPFCTGATNLGGVSIGCADTDSGVDKQACSDKLRTIRSMYQSAPYLSSSDSLLLRSSRRVFSDTGPTFWNSLTASSFRRLLKIEFFHYYSEHSAQ